MNKPKVLLVSAGLLAVLAGLMLFGSWAILFNHQAKGVALGFRAALVRTYEMGRPIPDGQYVIGNYRVEAAHDVQPGRQVTVRVKVMENRTGIRLVESTQSAAAY
jgi:hypothetical protein